MTIEEIIKLKESEDNVEFKEAKGGNISYKGGTGDYKKRRRCIVGYVSALANEGGGYMVFGIKESKPHIVVGTQQSEGNLGSLESSLYNDLGIRVTTEELYDDDDKRVLVIEVPSRPIGKALKFEDVALMRVGEELKGMSDKQYHKIIQEQEPDFSYTICAGVSMDDLDDEAIKILKGAYAKKQKNPQFQTLSKEQVLTDLELIREGKVTYAAIILVGKEEVLKDNIPQATIRLEYRKEQGQITFDQREMFTQSFFLEVDNIWKTINSRNGSIPIQDGAFIFDIPYFNQEVIREAVNNAVAHRSYVLSSEIVIKQFDRRLDIISPGGFPIGVNLENLLSVSSTPRNRLLTDVLQKTGIVERSGQGIDKIYYQTLKEGKTEPDFSNSDDYQVELKLSAVIEDKAFALFIESVQIDLKADNKLSVMEVITLNRIRKGDGRNLDKECVQKLLERSLIEKRGKTRGTYYVLSSSYYEFSDEKGKYSKMIWDEDQTFMMILQHLKKFEKAKMKDFEDLFEGRLTRKQVRTIVKKLLEGKELNKHGSASGTYYMVGENYLESLETLNKDLKLRIEQSRKKEEL